ncbi:nucleotide-diphospho-sugar transferase [Poseidonibacter ostreae]|uniref:Nucleotide-diphospho-sugar transferase n=1 Tax=Poseidonibacter ostreae TaxID=2654171 RepID=A0ABQ6VPS9_9BACT|nr:nucleotide-diphospho-sugar transferase [Poseidonibacter ostreae]KAB7892665.1 nucleotide-diphospho-sugar transferase [Poseidonibacter ostreae]
MKKIAKFIPPQPLKTAVLFLVFNRLDTTKQVFDSIRKAKPPRLYIAADGPRETKEGESQKAQEVREYILSNIDWECEIKTLFREQNLGCKMAVSGAIDWFFENEEMGIILEDDCLPSQSFFWFCEELLEKYKNDMRVGMISGFNYGYKNKDLTYDYFFSKYGFIWGWASWKRAWKHYDITMENHIEAKKIDLYENYFNANKKQQIANFESVFNNSMNTWDYQWSYARLINNSYSIVPSKNLIENIGFGDDATHTFGNNPYEKLQKVEYNNINLNHPSYIIQMSDFYTIFEKKNNLFNKVIRRILK